MSDQISRFMLPALCMGAVLLGACSQDPAENTSVDAESQTADAEATSYEPAARADEQVAVRQVQTPFGMAEIEELSVEGGAHSEAGRLHVRYLAADGSVAADYPEAVVMGSWGAMGDWSVREDLGRFPVIEAHGGGTWQGYTCGWTSLTELRPDGPLELLSFLDYHDNAGAGRDPHEEYSATLEGPAADGTLTVRYAGTNDAVVTYRRQGAAYEAVSGEEPEGC